MKVPSLYVHFRRIAVFLGFGLAGCKCIFNDTSISQFWDLDIFVLPEKTAPATLIPRTENSLGAKLFYELTHILHFTSAFPHQIIYIKFNSFFFSFSRTKKEEKINNAMITKEMPEHMYKSDLRWQGQLQE